MFRLHLRFEGLGEARVGSGDENRPKRGVWHYLGH